MPMGLVHGIDYIEHLEENYILIFRPMNEEEIGTTPGAGWADTNRNSAY